jgi:hypothetical protein
MATIPLAKNVIIALEKVADSGTFTPIGCSTSVNQASTVETTRLNCRSGSEEVVSDEPNKDWSFTGVRKLGQGAEEISFDDLEDWHDAGIRKKFQIIDATLIGTTLTPTVGGVKKSAMCVIQSCSRDAGETGNQMYNIALKPSVSTLVKETITA